LVAPGTIREFDLSDRLGRLGDIDGLWRVLTDFLVRIGDRGSGVLPSAVDAAMAELTKLER
jgi:alpha-glucoside transport system substrate-binding protein